MRILGIDPGSVICGYGVIDVEGSNYKIVEYGAVHVKRASTSFPQRLNEIHERLKAVIDRTQPDEAAMEKVFHAKNVKSIVQLSQARGVAVLACAQSKLEPFEYTPMQVKRAVTGRGAANKDAVATMVKAILSMEGDPEHYDITDALAVALCHAINGEPPPPIKKHRTNRRKAWSEFVQQKGNTLGYPRTVILVRATRSFVVYLTMNFTDLKGIPNVNSYSNQRLWSHWSPRVSFNQAARSRR